jgi:hypothetical protein
MTDAYLMDALTGSMENDVVETGAGGGGQPC